VPGENEPNSYEFNQMQTETLIIGGGLSGLSLAHALHKNGRDYRLLEARERLGGRIESFPMRNSNRILDRYDLGPGWFWPGQQRMASLARELGLTVFEQYTTGGMLVQNPDGSISEPMSFSGMAGALRIEGGMMALVDGLQSRLPTDRLLTNHVVIRIERTTTGIIAKGHSIGAPFSIEARRVVLAIPPRLVEHSIVFEPALSQLQYESMRRIPTWMAAHAKIIAVYASPFWRAKGLSGDAMSRRGPLAEIHDASPASGNAGALFGFVGLQSSQRVGKMQALETSTISQLTAIFGPEAADPMDVLVKDWAQEAFTATPNDLSGSASHPTYGISPELAHLWDGTLVLGSTEVADVNGGLLEGALESAESAFASTG
jgi:monoamine oxidase